MIRVIVSRKWKHPEIMAYVTDDEVGAAMMLPQFIQSLAQQVGDPTHELQVKLMEALPDVLREMKRATRYVV